MTKKDFELLAEIIRRRFDSEPTPITRRDIARVFSSELVSEFPSFKHHLFMTAADSDECEECGRLIPDTDGGAMENKYHATSCSLYNPENE